MKLVLTIHSLLGIMFIRETEGAEYSNCLLPPSSRGLGHLPFTEKTGIRIPLGVKDHRINQSSTPFSFFMSRYIGPRLRIVRRLGKLRGLTRKKPFRRAFKGKGF